MKKSTFFGLVLAIACAAGTVLAFLYILKKGSVRLPFMSGREDADCLPEEDLLEDTTDYAAISQKETVPAFEEDSEADPPASSHEERRTSRVRRGYIPLKFHEKAEL